MLSSIAAWIIDDERLGSVQLAGAAVVLVTLGAIICDARQASPEVEAALPVAAD